MGIFTSVRETIDNLRNTAVDYIDTQVKLLKLQAAEKISGLLSSLVAYLVLFFFLTFFLLFASIAGAYVLSDIIGKPYTGFLIVAGFYFLVGIAIYRWRDRLLKRPLLDAIVRQLFKDRTDKTG